MKIALIADYFLADMGYPKISLAKTWQRQGHVVRVLCSNRYFPFHNYQHTVEQLIGSRFRSAGVFTENGINVERKPTLVELFARVFYVGIGSFLKKYEPDVVFVFGVTSCSAVQVTLIRLLFGKRFTLVMVDSHLPSELMLGNQLTKRLFYVLFRALFSRLITAQTDLFIATQDKTIDVINHVYGVTAPVKLIPNGTDTEAFTKNLGARKELRKKFSISDSDFVIIYTGKIIKQKGVHILCKAFNALERTDAFMLLVGDGPQEYRGYCESLVQPRLKKNLIWAGYQPQSLLPQYYSAADIAVWPLQESLAMNDAASCELPFIANHTMGDKTRVSNHNALLYKKEDHNDLAQKIEQLYSDRKLRLAMGKRGRQLVERQLSWNKLAQDYLV